jgi:hypothetical protein
LNDYDEVFDKLSISETYWSEVALKYGLSVEEYKMLHRRAWESFTIPKHRMFMNVALEGMIKGYKESRDIE